MRVAVTAAIQSLEPRSPSRSATAGASPPRAQQTAEALAAFQKAEIDKWWPIVKEAGIKVE